MFWGKSMGIIALYNIEYRVGGQTILKNLDFELYRGECFVIMGRSGCGKSTLLRLITGLIRPTSGRIEIEGVDTGSLTKPEWHRIRYKMGMVFQSSALFDSLNVFENVAFGLRNKKLPEPEIKERVYKSLSIVGLEETIAAKMPAELSGGMKKRTAIARAIAFEPPILLYDEPTTGLDPIVANTINELICNLQSGLGITSIVVTHDIMSALKVADRIGLLHEGNLVEVTARSELKSTRHPMFAQFLKDYQSLIDTKS
jgi:phospholipid/cholesterol/gamma-HCH transport system ATP-binding protein